MVIDIVLPAVLGLVLVWEAGIKAWVRRQCPALFHSQSLARSIEVAAGRWTYQLESRLTYDPGRWEARGRSPAVRSSSVHTSHKLEGLGLALCVVGHVCGYVEYAEEKG